MENLSILNESDMPLSVVTQLKVLECCLAQKALAIASEFHCGDVPESDWQELLMLDMYLDSIKGSLDYDGKYHQASISFQGNIIGCECPITIEGETIATLTVIEGDIAGVGDIEKSLELILPQIREFFNVEGAEEFDYPLVEICLDGSVLTFSIHPYFVYFAPDEYADNVEDWVIGIGAVTNCDIPAEDPPTGEWVQLSATADEFCGGVTPMHINPWCIDADHVRRMYSKIIEKCCVNCGIENIPPDSYLEVTGGEPGCTDCGDTDTPDMSAIYVQGGISLMGIELYCNPFTVYPEAE